MKSPAHPVCSTCGVDLAGRVGAAELFLEIKCIQDSHEFDLVVFTRPIQGWCGAHTPATFSVDIGWIRHELEKLQLSAETSASFKAAPAELKQPSQDGCEVCLVNSLEESALIYLKVRRIQETEQVIGQWCVEHFPIEVTRDIPAAD